MLILPMVNVLKVFKDMTFLEICGNISFCNSGVCH